MCRMGSRARRARAQMMRMCTLLLRVLAAAPDARALLCFAATCRLCTRLAGTESLWRERLQSDLGVTDTINPSALVQAPMALFRSFHTLSQLCWNPLEIKECDASPVRAKERTLKKWHLLGEISEQRFKLSQNYYLTIFPVSFLNSL